MAGKIASPAPHDGDYNAFSFWRAPIEATPILSEVAPPPPPPPALSEDSAAPPSFALNEPTAGREQHVVTQDQIRKLDMMLKPMRIEGMSTADIQARLADFESDFRKRHGRPIALADAQELPRPVLEMYDQLGRRLSPEERAQAQTRLEARQAAETAAKAQAEAEAAVAAEKRAASAGARAREWEAFEANKEAVWRAASSEAREQREEAAAEHGLSASSLTGASTWLKVDEPGKREQSKEEMIEQFRLERGLSARREELTEEQRQRETAEWSAKGGAEADALARQEAWTKRTKQRNLQSAAPSKPLVKVLGPVNDPQARKGAATANKKAPMVVRAVPSNVAHAQAVD